MNDFETNGKTELLRMVRSATNDDDTKVWSTSDVQANFMQPIDDKTLSRVLYTPVGEMGIHQDIKDRLPGEEAFKAIEHKTLLDFDTLKLEKELQQADEPCAAAFEALLKTTAPGSLATEVMKALKSAAADTYTLPAAQSHERMIAELNSLMQGNEAICNAPGELVNIVQNWLRRMDIFPRGWACLPRNGKPC